MGKQGEREEGFIGLDGERDKTAVWLAYTWGQGREMVAGTRRRDNEQEGD